MNPALEKLTVLELVEAKVALERQVFDAATEALDEFYAATGIAAAGLTLDFVDVSTFECVKPKRLLVRVRAEVEL